MKGKPRWAVNVRTDIEASDEWLNSLTRGGREARAGDHLPQTARTASHTYSKATARKGVTKLVAKCH